MVDVDLVGVAVFLGCQQVYRSQEDLLSRAKKPINYEVKFKKIANLVNAKKNS